MTDELTIRTMTRPELDVLVEWAAAEGWNPGLGDAQIFWDTDPDGFIAAERGGELIGGGSIVSYDGRFGFMGFFIIREDHRSRGLGRRLWRERKRRLEARLDPPARIGLDGVFDMQDFYARGGFVFSARGLRFEGRGTAPLDHEHIRDASSHLAAAQAYDAQHFPTPRPEFIRRWIQAPGHTAVVWEEKRAVRGLAVMRPCRQGFKIGPLFADTPSIADTLYRHLAGHAGDASVFLDVPENNPEAMALAARHDLREVFGCARMYAGPPPALPVEQIYGITTFELG